VRCKGTMTNKDEGNYQKQSFGQAIGKMSQGEGRNRRNKARSGTMETEGREKKVPKTASIWKNKGDH